MKEKFAELEKQIKDLEREITRCRERKAEAENQITEMDQVILKSLEELENALVNSDTKGIDSLENEIEVAKKSINRNRTLIPGLNQQLTGLDTRLAEVQEKRNQAFGDLVRISIARESKVYDEAAKQMIVSNRRLTACYLLLQERGLVNVYRDEVGPASEVLSAARIPIIFGFDKASYTRDGQLVGPGLRHQFVPDKALMQSVFQEIVNESK